jgi:hypothetical protein
MLSSTNKAHSVVTVSMRALSLFPVCQKMMKVLYLNVPGISALSVYAFGENDLYTIIDQPEGSMLCNVQVNLFGLHWRIGGTRPNKSTFWFYDQLGPVFAKNHEPDIFFGCFCARFSSELRDIYLPVNWI